MDKMRKYREAFKSIQMDYEFFIDVLDYPEEDAYNFCKSKLMGVVEVAIYDIDINSDDNFQEINSYEIVRREHEDGNKACE